MGNYVDKIALMHVIGNLYNNLELTHDERYPMCLDDFYDDFHKTLYSILYELYNFNTKNITEIEILDYLTGRPKAESIFNKNNGFEYLKECAASSQISSFDYYYYRMKKFTLLEAYSRNGINIDYLYDPNEITDTKKIEQQNNWLDNTKIENIADVIENKCLELHGKYIDNIGFDSSTAFEGLEDLIENLLDNPAFGYPLYGDYINNITRGARLGELYLRSASTGTGKSRMFVADSCYIGLSSYYDEKKRVWVDTNAPEPTLLISTEQQKIELQTMILAFVSGVPEEHILLGNYETDEEYDRILKAIEIIKNGKLRVFTITDFKVSDIVNIIKRSIRTYHTKYFFLDYLHTSIGILSEIGTQTKGIALREDQILFMLADKLKQICLEEGVFIYTGTQLNADYTKGILDQNALRGSKAIADKISVGSIVVKTTAEDLSCIKSILEQNPDFPIPTIKISIYKNRGGKYNNIYLWCEDRRDYCKINPIFVTDNNYEFINLFDVGIKVV